MDLYPGKKRYTLIIFITAVLAVIVGVLVIAGWIFNIDSFKSIIKGFNTMKFNTAICIILSALSLLAIKFKNRLYLLFSLVLFILAGLTLLQDLLQCNFGIDELIIPDLASQLANKPFPGRMAPTTSFGFILLAIAFLLLKTKSRIFKNIGQYALHIVTLISFIAIVGYIYNVPSFYKLSFLVSMAVHTAVLLFLLSIAASLVNFEYGITSFFIGKRIGSVMARRIFPLTLVLIVLLGYFRLESHRMGMVSTEFGIALFAISFMLVTLFIVGNTSRYLNNIDAQRSEAEEALIQMNNTLEERIKERTENLVASEEKFYKAFQMSTAGMTLSDISTGKLLEVNQSFINMIGYSKAEMKDKTSLQLNIVTPEQRAINVALLQRDGFLRNHEVKLLTRHGEKVALISIEFIDVGAHKLALTVLHDITERKETELKLQEAKNIAELARKEQEQFLANMSHELRTPLNSMLILSKLLSNNMQKNLTEKQVEQALTVYKAGKDLLTLINDILDISKIEAGEVRITPAEVMFRDIKENIQSLFAPVATHRNIYFDLDMAMNLPVVIFTDIQRLEQILKNLLSNAFKFTSQEGHVSVKIEQVSYQYAPIPGGLQTGDMAICFSVIDTGIGIPKDKQENIFMPFKQVDGSISRKYGGTGLGLSISKKLAALLGGDIILESEQDKGSTFMLFLPVTS